MSFFPQVLNGGLQTPPPDYTQPPTPDGSTTTTPWPTPEPNIICDGAPGLKPHPTNCRE